MASSPIVTTTGHDANGKSIFIPNPAFKPFNANVGVIYKTLSDGPIDLSNGADLTNFANHDLTLTGPIPKEGSAVLIAEFPPGCNSEDHTHRTLSVDVGVVIQGEIECHLDSGEKRVIKTGEVLIQRGTKHYWVNPSGDTTARVVFFVMPAKAVAEVKD